MYNFQFTAIMLGKEWKNNGISIANNAVVWAAFDHPFDCAGIAVVTAFTEIAKRLIDFSAAILMHHLPVARAGKNVVNHFIERLRSVSAGANEKTFKFDRDRV